MNKKMFQRGNFLYRAFTFSGYISPTGFWSELVMRGISFFCATILMCIAVCVFVPGDVEELIELSQSLVPVLGIFWVIPIVPLTRRRLRDAGLSPKNYLWLLLPVIGLIIFVIKLCAKSVPRKAGEIWFDE